MTFPTHIIAGLIIGKLTGDYPAALAGSLLMDVDHIVSYYRHGILSKPKEILRASVEEADPWGDQKNFLHSAQSWLVISLVLLVIDLRFGLIFSLAYLVHLILDGLNGSFYPLYPYRRFSIQEPVIRYLSRREAFLGVVLIVIFFVV